MIYRACDSCEEWFHGDCVNITESGAKSLKRYYCPPCVYTNPTLKLEYKKAKVSKDRAPRADPTPKATRPTSLKVQSDNTKDKRPGPGRPAKKGGRVNLSTFHQKHI